MCTSTGFWIGLAIIATIVALLAVCTVVAMSEVVKLINPSKEVGRADGKVAKTLYDLLGASPDDDAERLKEAFRKAVRASHPDLHPSDPDATVRLSGIVRAYAILRDARERMSYDQSLDLERESFGSEPKRTFLNAMHRIFTEAGSVAALAVMLSAGYALLANVLSLFP
jgi:hypothetical protein